MILILVVMVLMFQILTDGLLLTPLNMTNIVLQNSYIVILAIGMLPIIITARIDLSVGSIAAVVGAVAAVMMVKKGTGFLVTLLTGLLLGGAIGAWHGFWVAVRNIPAFIVTLSSQLVFRGLTVVILDGRSIGPFSEEFQALSSSFLPDIFSSSGLHLTTILIAIVACVALVFKEINARAEQRKYNFATASLWGSVCKTVLTCAILLGFAYFFAAYQGFPTVMLIMIALVLIYSFITRRTIIGRHLYAVGGNEKAAGLSGVKIKKVLFAAFVNMGVLAGLAGRFIGGASVSGGTGTISGALVGCFIMGVMNNGMSIMGIAVDLQQAIKGLVILFAVAFDLYAKSKEA
jgi:putative multiple sugar transport system permease protein